LGRPKTEETLLYPERQLSPFPPRGVAAIACALGPSEAKKYLTSVINRAYKGKDFICEVILSHIKVLSASDDFEPLGPIFSVTAQGGVRLLIANSLEWEAFMPLDSAYCDG